MRQLIQSYDQKLLFAALALLAIGLVMVCSASITMAESMTGRPLYFFLRQATFAGLGLFLAWLILTVRLSVWQQYAAPLMLVGMVMLVMVLIPGVGREVNGSARWLPLGPVNLQVAELVKLLAILYVADYMQRHYGQTKDWVATLGIPMAIFGATTLLLLMQPDMGSVVVILSTVVAMLFLGGARLSIFIALISVLGGLFALLTWIAPYRLQRLQSFMDPWADPFGSGFQLTQALIAFGRGDWLGVGLGSSMQKLFYLPEAHTDFLYSILAEELGLFGALIVMGLFLLLVWRALSIGYAAEQAGQKFGSQVAYGIGIWLGIQAFVNMGVNMGVLPTKGLTLPLMSYGGSSLLIVCVAIALLLRVDIETRQPEQASARVRR